MSTEVARILRNAADLIEPPGRWTRGTYARTVEGTPTISKDEEAVCWCASGALSRVANPHALWPKAMDALSRLISRRSVGAWNDSQPNAAPVVAALRAAADAVGAEEARNG